MALLDLLKHKAQKAARQAAQQAVKTAVQTVSNKRQTIVFETVPATYEQFTNLPQAAMDTPFVTAAMTVLALSFYPTDKEMSLAMLDFLKGPRPLSPAEKQFIADRFRGKDYVPRSYFGGATPQNDYQPDKPYSVTVSDNPYSYQNQNYATLYIASGGADNPRSVQLRLAKDGKWYLWEQLLLADVRPPESTNPWA